MSSDLVERCTGLHGDWERFRYKKVKKFNRLFLLIGWMIACDTLSRKHILHIVFSFPSRSSEEFATRKPWVVIGICYGIVCSRGYDELWGICLIIAVRELINSYIYMSPNYRNCHPSDLCRRCISLYHNFKHPNYHGGDICGLSSSTGSAKSSNKPTLVRRTRQW